MRGDRHISLTFLQALHRMYINVSFFPILQNKKCLTSSTCSHLHISKYKTCDQVLLRNAILFGFVFLEKLSAEAMFLHYQKQLLKSLYYLSDPVIICSVSCPFKDTTLHFLGLRGTRPHSKLNLDVLLDLNFQFFRLGYETSD